MRATPTTAREPVVRATRRPPGRADSHKRWTDRRGPDHAVSDVLRCGPYANGTAIDGGATELFPKDTHVKGIANAGRYTSIASWTLTLGCSHDATLSDGSTWTALDGAVQAIDKGPIN